MGTCISRIHKNTSSSAKVVVVVEISEDNNPSSVPPTPVKPKPAPTPTLVPVPVPVDLSSIISNSFNSRISPLHSFSTQGSREEAFHDTQGWLDSDCEDDFYSVHGDFTPSRGNTPVHPSIGTSPLSAPRSVSPPNNYALEKDKSSRFSQPCFPRLVSEKTYSRSSSVDDIEKSANR